MHVSMAIQGWCGLAGRMNGTDSEVSLFSPISASFVSTLELVLEGFEIQVDSGWCWMYIWTSGLRIERPGMVYD